MAAPPTSHGRNAITTFVKRMALPLFARMRVLVCLMRRTARRANAKTQNPLMQGTVNAQHMLRATEITTSVSLITRTFTALRPATAVASCPWSLRALGTALALQYVKTSPIGETIMVTVRRINLEGSTMSTAHQISPLVQLPAGCAPLLLRTRQRTRL